MISRIGIDNGYGGRKLKVGEIKLKSSKWNWSGKWNWMGAVRTMKRFF